MCDACTQCRDTTDHHGAWRGCVQVIGEILRDPSRLDQSLCPELAPDLLARLRHDIVRCVYTDCCYSPLSDVAKQATGLEYELYLQQCLTQSGIAFWSESDLRRLGFHKTPDFKLKVSMPSCRTDADRSALQESEAPQCTARQPAAASTLPNLGMCACRTTGCCCAHGRRAWPAGDRFHAHRVGAWGCQSHLHMCV